jgi:hypothetical protein
MTHEELDALEALANAATPGEWFVDWDEGVGLEVYSYDAEGRPVTATATSKENAAFIAVACRLAPALVAEVRRLRANCSAIPNSCRSELGSIHAQLEATREAAFAERLAASLARVQPLTPEQRAIVCADDGEQEVSGPASDGKFTREAGKGGG